MRVMEKPSSQKYVRSVLSLHTDLDFAVIPGSVLRRPESIQFSIKSSRNVHRPWPDEFPGELEV